MFQCTLFHYFSDKYSSIYTERVSVNYYWTIIWVFEHTAGRELVGDSDRGSFDPIKSWLPKHNFLRLSVPFRLTITSPPFWSVALMWALSHLLVYLLLTFVFDFGLGFHCGGFGLYNPQRRYCRLTHGFNGGLKLFGHRRYYLNTKDGAVERDDNSIELKVLYQTEDFTLEPHISPSELGTTLEKSPSLVLNADYTPLSFLPLSLWSWQDSLRAVLTNKATMVAGYGVYIRSVHFRIEMPSVIALKHYQKTPSRPPRVSRRNVYLRDGFKCQYCMVNKEWRIQPSITYLTITPEQHCCLYQGSFHPSDLSLDHVVPRVQGGKLTWNNVATACRACNFKKGQTVPEDLSRIGMKLRKLPTVPSMYELQAKSKKYRRVKAHPDWEDYLVWDFSFRTFGILVEIQQFKQESTRASLSLFDDWTLNSGYTQYFISKWLFYMLYSNEK